MAGLRKHEPVPENDMFYRSPAYTICEVLRDIYHEADFVRNETIKIKAREAVAMAKAMDAKLREYNSSWKAGFYDNNEKNTLSIS